NSERIKAGLKEAAMTKKDFLPRNRPQGTPLLGTPFLNSGGPSCNFSPVGEGLRFPSVSLQQPHRHATSGQIENFNGILDSGVLTCVVIVPKQRNGLTRNCARHKHDVANKRAG